MVGLYDEWNFGGRYLAGKIEKLKLELKFLFLGAEKMKNVRGDSNNNNPCPEHGRMRFQLLQCCSFVRLAHEHSRKHDAFFSDLA